MFSPETFRSQAAECLRLAESTSDPRHRSLLLRMAKSWTVLAESAEQLETLLERHGSLAKH